MVIVPKIFVDEKVEACPPVSEALSTVGIPQVYNVPAGKILLPPVVGVTVNCAPVQITVFISARDGVGFRLTVTVNTFPVHVPNEGVTK